MSILIFNNEASANSRTIHFRTFLSDGTSPDTGSSNSSVIQITPSGGTFTPNAKIQAAHAAQGMYFITLNQSDVTLSGMNSLYFTQGSFPQHLASFDVVAFNPFDGARLALSNITLGPADYGSNTTFGVSTIKAGTYSGVTVGSAATILAGTYSGVTVGINNIAAGNYSGVTTSGVTATNVLDKSSYGVTSIAAGTYSGVTVGSLATLVPADYTSKVTVGVGGFNAGVITTAAYAAAALDSTVFATNAEQAFADRFLLRSIAGGVDSGRTVGTALYALRNKVDASSSVGTVYGTDDTTSAWTFSNTTGAFPISSVDPA